jgi:hypothetical protein
MKIIIENDGHNHWLVVVDGTPHCDVRRDFVDTTYGISIKPREIIAIDVEL